MKPTTADHFPAFASVLSSNRTTKNLHRLIFILPLFLLAGCGYHWRSTYREDVRTVAVPIFQNKTFERGSEIALTKAVVNRLELHSPYRVTAHDKADTLLEGEITSINIREVSRDLNTNLPQEKTVTFLIDFRWKDLRTGQILVERRNFQQQTLYYPTLGEAEFNGSQQAIERVALAIVQELEAEW